MNELLEAARRVSQSSPLVSKQVPGWGSITARYCVFCDAAVDDRGHTATCPWALLKDVVTRVQAKREVTLEDA